LNGIYFLPNQMLIFFEYFKRTFIPLLLYTFYPLECCLFFTYMPFLWLPLVYLCRHSLHSRWERFWWFFKPGMELLLINTMLFSLHRSTELKGFRLLFMQTKTWSWDCLFMTFKIILWCQDGQRFEKCRR